MSIILTLQNGPVAWYQNKIVCHNEDFVKIIILGNIIKKYDNHSIISKSKNNISVKSHLSSNNTLASARWVVPLK